MERHCIIESKIPYCHTKSRDKGLTGVFCSNSSCVNVKNCFFYNNVIKLDSSLKMIRGYCI